MTKLTCLTYAGDKDLAISRNPYKAFAILATNRETRVLLLTYTTTPCCNTSTLVRQARTLLDSETISQLVLCTTVAKLAYTILHALRCM